MASHPFYPMSLTLPCPLRPQGRSGLASNSTASSWTQCWFRKDVWIHEPSRAIETEKDPVGLLGTKAFLSPFSCRQDSSLHDLPWVPKGRRAAKKPPEARLKGPEKLIKIRRSELRLREWRPCTHPNLSCQQSCPWTIAIKLLIKSSLVGTHSFEGRSPLCPPLPDKAINLLFSTLPKILSQRFNSAPVYRGFVTSVTIRDFYWGLVYGGWERVSLFLLGHALIRT